MATFAGDLMRILAHGGMNMGTAALGQYLGNMWAGDRAMDLEGVKVLAEQAKNAPTPDTQQSLLGAMYEKLGMKPPMVTETKGYASPGLEPSVGTPKPEDVILKSVSPFGFQGVPGATAIDKTQIAGPTNTLEALKSKVAADVMAGGTNPAQDLLYPKEPTLQAAYIKAKGDWAIRESEGEANRVTQMAIAKMVAEGKEEARLATQEHRGAMLGVERDKMEQQRKVFGVLVKRTGDATALKHSADINTAWDDYKNALTTSPANPKLVAAAVEKYNKNIELAEQRVPEMAGHFSPLTPEYTQAWHEFGNTPGTKLKGYVPTPKSTKGSVLPSVSQQVPGFQGAGNYMIKGQKTPVSSQEEYNRLMK